MEDIGTMEGTGRVSALLEDLDDYIRDADPPILTEYAHQHGLTGEELKALADTELEAGRPALSRSLKRLLEAKAIKLERGALSGAYKTTAAVFSLKQLGWTGEESDSGDGEGQGVILLGEVLDEGV